MSARAWYFLSGFAYAVGFMALAGAGAAAWFRNGTWIVASLIAGAALLAFASIAGDNGDAALRRGRS